MNTEYECTCAGIDEDSRLRTMPAGPHHKTTCSACGGLIYTSRREHEVIRDVSEKLFGTPESEMSVPPNTFGPSPARR